MPSHPYFLTCPAMQDYCSLERRKPTKQLLGDDVDGFLHHLPAAHLPHGKCSPTREEMLEKHSQGECRVGTHPLKTHLRLGLQLYFLHAPQQNFLWISDHSLFPITLLFTLSIWRIQMLNDKRGRRRREGEKNSILPGGEDTEMPPRAASPKRSSMWQRLAQLSLCQMII